MREFNLNRAQDDNRIGKSTVKHAGGCGLAAKRQEWGSCLWELVLYYSSAIDDTGCVNRNSGFLRDALYDQCQ